MSLFADVILPLPLPDAFTYAIPPEMEDAIAIGSRVYVQFGKSNRKCYTAVVVALHDNAPTEYEVKEILQLLDSDSIIRYPQLKLWKWISDYYLCTLGDVYKAALPVGLKIESETMVCLNADFEASEPKHLTEKQALIVATLQHEERLSLHQLADKCGIQTISPIVARLLDIGIVEIDERTADRYRPVKKTLVRLTCSREDDNALHEILVSFPKNARAWERLLLTYLNLSRWQQRDMPLKEVERKELADAATVNSSVMKKLTEKGIFEVYTRVVNRFNRGSEQNQTIPLSPLSPLQTEALDSVRSQFREHNVVLLRGVTGSGKTEIYTHLIQQTLNQGNQVLYLVPEISLTTQLTDRLRRFFGDKLVVYHSKFSDNERVDLWRRILSSHEPIVALGARSAVFLPFAHLGLVIVDEEHESSFKQYDPAPRYNGRDTAIVLASMHGAKTLLGSATPSVETYCKAKTGKYGLVELTVRFSGAVMPDVEVIDMRKQRKQKTVYGSLSFPLIQAVGSSIGSRRQAILFQNRRGFAPMVECGECGWKPKCQNCDVSMVYHKAINQLRCHYCGYSIQLPTVCPACGLPGIEIYGYGTERIAEEVHDKFPDARVSRMDLDTTRNKNAYQDIIEKFASHQTDILIGTQMVSKGLDFEKVDTVGVVSADTLLNFPDFRSDERAFNMLEQVAGRAGRRADKGKVMIQTTSPDNPVLRYVCAHDYEGFYNAAIADRQRFGYPPFTKVIIIYMKHRDRDTLNQLAVAYTKMLMQVFGNRVLGPEPPLIPRVANRYIQTVMLKVEAQASMAKVKKILRDIYVQLAADPRMRQLVLYYDVDPS